MTTKEQAKQSDIESALRNSSRFSNLGENTTRELAERFTPKLYRKGAEIVAYQDNTEEVYFVVSGRVRVTIYSFDGKEITYEDLGPGEMFGELSAIDRQPRTANVMTLEKSVIGVLSGADFWNLLRGEQEFMESVLNRVAGMVRLLASRVYQYAAMDVKDRVRVEVFRLASDSPDAGDTAIVQNFPTHTEIANRINTHREAVTRELNELSKLGIIEQDKRVLKIVSLDRLKELLPDNV